MKLTTLQRYTYGFAFLNLFLLGAAVVVIVIVSEWQAILSRPVSASNVIYTRLTVSDSLITAGFSFSGAAFVVVMASIWPLTTSPSKENAANTPLAVYLVVLLISFLITMAIATATWFVTLRERALFTPVWMSLSSQNQVYIQNNLKCCGWYNATAAGLFSNNLRTGFCANPAAIKPDPDPNVVLGCVDKVVSKADHLFNYGFTTIYGFTGIQFALFLVAACIANLRIQQKRFLRIDYKLRENGRGGFV